MLGLFLGVVGLPHVLIRLYTVKDAVAARKSTELTIISLAIFYTMTLFVGFAAMMLLYPLLTDLIDSGEVGKATNTAVAELGNLLGGQLLLGIVLAGAMAAILSSAVGLLIQMTTTVAHDGYTVLLRPESSEEQRVMVARGAGIVLTVVAVALSILLKEENVAQLVGMTFGIAATTFAPVLLMTVWWTRYTRQGVVATFIVGLIVSLAFTAARYGGVETLVGLPVLVNPALYGVPAAFAAGIIVSLLTRMSEPSTTSCTWPMTATVVTPTGASRPKADHHSEYGRRRPEVKGESSGRRHVQAAGARGFGLGRRVT